MAPDQRQPQPQLQHNNPVFVQRKLRKGIFPLSTFVVVVAAVAFVAETAAAASADQPLDRSPYSDASC